MSVSYSPIIDKHKMLLAMAFGLAGFIFNFFSFEICTNTFFRITLLPGLLFPLLIALAWGWKYALISALAGGCQSMWWIWNGDGYGLLYSVPIFTLWIVWHGYGADLRKKYPIYPWYLSCFVLELPFRMCSALGFYTLFPALVAQNSPSGTIIPSSWLSIAVSKHIISAYILLLLVTFLLRIKPVRIILGLKARKNQTATTKILICSLLIAAGLCVLRDIVTYFAFNPTNKTLYQLSMWTIGGRGLFTGSLYIIASLGGGLFINRSLEQRAKQNDKIGHLNQILLAIRNVNKLIVQEKNPETLLAQACNLLIETRGYSTAWIVTMDKDILPPFFEAGFHGAFAPLAKYLRERHLPPCVHRALQSPMVHVEKNPLSCQDCPLAPCHRRRTVIATRIKHQGKIYGVIAVSLPDDLILDLPPQDLFREMADDVGHALYSIENNLLQTRLGKAVHHSLDGILMTDKDRNILYANPAFEQQSGFDRDELIGMDAISLCQTATDRAVLESMHKTLTKGHPVQGTLIKRKKDGSSYMVDSSINCSYTSDGRVDCAIAINRDVTEQRELEEQVIRAQRLDSVGKMAGGIAHDINNLLTPVLGFIELLQLKLPSGDPNLKITSEILKAGLRSRDLIRQLLSFARKETLTLKPVVLSEVVLGLEMLLRNTLHEDITLDIINSTSRRNIMADEGRLEQIIVNLAVNARDAMPDGGVLNINTADLDVTHENTQVHNDLPEGHYVQLEVIDSGYGMDAETSKKIFEPFFTTKEQNGESGTGLGLATVYGIVKQHKGTISVHSQPNQGTTFALYFPACDDRPAPSPTTQPATMQPGTHKTVLLVEDDALVRQSVTLMLDHCGYEVIGASSPSEALEYADCRGHLDMLITDITMPEMNGYEMSRKILENHPETHVVFMSGYNENIISHDILQQSAYGFIQKPFTLKEFKNKLISPQD